MPLTAWWEGVLVDATVVADDVWARVHRVRPAPELRCRGCEGKLTARLSKRQTRHFYHRSRVDDCPSNGESADHLRLKALLAASIRRCGADAEVEAMPRPGDVGGWRADVLAMGPDGSRVAFEVQLAAMTAAEGVRRTGRYADDSIACCWVTHRRAPWLAEIASLRVDDAHDAPTVTAGLARWDTRANRWRAVLEPVTLERVVAMILGGAASPHALGYRLGGAGDGWGTPWDSKGVVWCRGDDKAAADIYDEARQRRDAAAAEKLLRREREAEANRARYVERFEATIPVAVAAARQACGPGQRVWVGERRLRPVLEGSSIPGDVRGGWRFANGAPLWIGDHSRLRLWAVVCPVATKSLRYRAAEWRDAGAIVFVADDAHQQQLNRHLPGRLEVRTATESGAAGSKRRSVEAEVRS